MANLLLQTLENASEKIARMMSASGCRVVFSPTVKTPCADIHRGVIMLPQLPDKIEKDDLAKLHGLIDHEVAHIMYTENVDGTRPDKPAGIRGLIENALEDGRINRIQSEKFLGSADNLNRLTEVSSAGHRKAIAEGKTDPNDPRYQVLMALIKASYTHVWKNDAAAGLIMDAGDDLLESIPAELVEQLRAIETFEDVRAAVEPTLEWIRAELDDEEEMPEEASAGSGDAGETDAPEDMDGEDGDGEGSGDGSGAFDDLREDGDEESDGSGDGDADADEDGDDESAGGSGDGAEDDESADADGDGESTSGDAEDGDAAPSGEERSRAAGEGTPDEGEQSDPFKDQEESLLAIAKALNEAIEEVVSEMIESCAVSGSYFSDDSLDREVHITDLHAEVTRKWSKPEYIQERAHHLFSDYRKYVSTLRTRLVMDLQSKGRMWQADQTRGKKIDSRQLARVGVADNRVFKNKIKRETLNTAVTLLIDCSGSMNGTPIGRAQQLAALFTEALEMANVPNEVLGFTTQARGDETSVGVRSEPLEHIIFKAWHERSTTHRDLWPACEEVLANNVDGESVLWAARRLSARKEPRKIMIVLSDGAPCAVTRGRGNVLNRHLKDVVKRIELSGIETIGIGMETDCVKEFYPKWVAYYDLKDMMSGVYKMISRLLRDGTLGAAA